MNNTINIEYLSSVRNSQIAFKAGKGRIAKQAAKTVAEKITNPLNSGTNVLITATAASAVAQVLMQNKRADSNQQKTKQQYISPYNFIEVSKGEFLTEKIKLLPGYKYSEECELPVEYIMHFFKDGSSRYWYANGQIKREYLPNGSTRQWYENGQIETEKLPDGSSRSWYKNGQIKKEYNSCTNRLWYKNGQIHAEKLPDGSSRSWYANGQIETEKLPDGSSRSWYANGQMETENLPDGSSRSWYENGQMQTEHLYNNSSRTWYTYCTWYRNGQLKSEQIGKNRTIRSWYENGQIKEEYLSGDTRKWDENGQVIEEWRHDNPLGPTHIFYENGQEKNRIVFVTKHL